MMLADWGQMLAFARNWIVGAMGNAFAYWYTYLPASAAIILYSAGWNLIGDGLRDVLDPRLR
jgi:peptide/nickel transport system permease protein